MVMNYVNEVTDNKLSKEPGDISRLRSRNRSAAHCVIVLKQDRRWKARLVPEENYLGDLQYFSLEKDCCCIESAVASGQILASAFAESVAVISWILYWLLAGRRSIWYRSGVTSRKEVAVSNCFLHSREW